jgi:transposase InsO family protein
MKGEHPVRLLCELLAVSRSGYYHWHERRPTQRQRDDERLAAKIAAAHTRSRKNYGAPRIVEELREEGTPISKRRCARLMKARGLQGRKKHRRRPRTTDSRHAHAPAENLLAKTEPPSGPNQAWVTDITYIETAEGWIYLAALLDVWSRRIVGWACGPTLHVSLVLTALQAALRQRKPAKGLLHHSDRGVQYACHDYASALTAAGLVCSMSRRGNCYDNATMESFWSTLKTETGLDAAVPIGRRAAELIVFDYIETFYNPTRRHSSLGYLSPVAFENQPTKNDIKAA